MLTCSIVLRRPVAIWRSAGFYARHLGREVLFRDDQSTKRRLRTPLRLRTRRPCCRRQAIQRLRQQPGQVEREIRRRNDAHELARCPWRFQQSNRLHRRATEGCEPQQEDEGGESVHAEALKVFCTFLLSNGVPRGGSGLAQWRYFGSFQIQIVGRLID